MMVPVLTKEANVSVKACALGKSSMPGLFDMSRLGRSGEVRESAPLVRSAIELMQLTDWAVVNSFFTLSNSFLKALTFIGVEIELGTGV